MKLLILLLAGVGLAVAQVPGFGGCPEFESQADFDMNKFLGTWYEAERYVNIFEAGTRCVKTNYTKAVDGRYLVANEIMNRFTSIKRVLEGEIRLVVKGSESKLNVKYPNLPIPYESQLIVLDTDYDSYSVMWSCSSLGIINTQNAWILTREKLAPGTVLQKAYGILDKYKLSRTFFVKTDQNSCEIAEAAENSSEATASTQKQKPQKKVGQKKGDQTSGREEEVKPEEVVPDVKKGAPVVPVSAPVPAPVVQAVVSETVADHKVASEQKISALVVEQKPVAPVADHKVVHPVVVDQSVQPVVAVADQKVVPIPTVV